MMKSVAIVSVLFFASALGCGTTVVSDNIVATAFYARTANGIVYFDLTVNNTVPGVQYPNEASSRISDVNSFAFINPNSGAGVRNPHVVFNAINGGASSTGQFGVPTSMTGNGKCLAFAFTYFQYSQQQYFFGSFELDAANVAPRSLPAESTEVEDGSLAARATCNLWTWISSDFTATTGTPTSNSYYIKSGAISGTGNYTNVAYSVSSTDSSVYITYNQPGPNFGSVPQNTNKYGNVIFNVPSAGTYTVTVTLNYGCAGVAQTPQTIQRTLTVTDKGAKRAIEVHSAVQSSFANSQLAVVLASAGVAVAGIALVVAAVAVVVVRRRSYGPIAA